MDLVSQLRTSLAAQSLPPASTSFLTTLISARTPPPPPASLLATAKARLLACDLTQSTGGILDADAMAALPADVGSARAEKRTLPRDVHVQVLDVENLSLSRWEQVEELESVERGERRQGREVIRVTAEEGEEEEGDGSSRATGTQGRGAGGAQQVTAAKNAVHRLVLQDCKGQSVYAVEMKRMDRIGIGKTSIGEKMLLRAGSVVARGSVLLTPDKTVFLGGKVESWHEAWTSGRLARLKAAVGADRPQ
ncbi:RecQ-mediated genome instability protein 1 [Beauveria bassiana]|uniref:RecQ mediated genome instability protein Rmi1 n=1 Tax=Beauveria bassiana (strain ARSEF 2860) TaxID=655819 RepID=J4WHL1_BEAB2|nr:RecQ mediated genome instability protein Rmi1 [Beauveria bassiana ARSEF 2860]EJP69350.1 RecQ mediated genome instability protein Rmi1 [Beauveria bassiana ARSEF 2860]KAF1737148.1 RecQ-mediated genome instability protein 1 [Beauveria bassiana]KAH8718153.1 RecQ-mediated genome instability protein 1 [Beauveria bassiana]